MPNIYNTNPNYLVRAYLHYRLLFGAYFEDNKLNYLKKY